MNVSEERDDLRYTVLVVDDDPNNLQLVASILHPLYKVLLLEKPVEVVKTCIEKKPDIVLLDLVMTGMSGYQVAQDLKSNDKTRAIPIIFLTMITSEELIDKAFSAGGEDYITKPFKAKELLARVRTHLRVSLLTKKLLEQNEFKDKLFSVIAHDLITPVFNIDLSLKLILQHAETLDKERAFEWIKKTRKSTSSTLDLLTNLLNWTKLQFKSMKYNPEWLSLPSEIEKVIAVSEIQLKNKNIVLDIEVPSDIKVYGDSVMLQAILRNLISNAIKFSHPGGAVLIEAITTGKEIAVSVTDNGTGISSENLAILQRGNFEHVTTYGTQGEKGTGIGLSIVKEFAQRHGGKLTVKSTVGVGSTFTLLLPMKDPETLQEDSASSAKVS